MELIFVVFLQHIFLLPRLFQRMQTDVDKDKIFVLKITLVDQTAVSDERDAVKADLTSLTVSPPTLHYCSLTEAETQVGRFCEANLYTLHTLLETFHC